MYYNKCIYSRYETCVPSSLTWIPRFFFGVPRELEASRSRFRSGPPSVEPLQALTSLLAGLMFKGSSLPSLLLSAAEASCSVSGDVFVGSNAEGCLATSPSVPDLVVSERSGLRVSRSSRPWSFSFLELEVVLNGALVARRKGVEVESWERVARVACWLLEMMDFHILLGRNGVISKGFKLQLRWLWWI
jgi:hypothetical protein